MCRCKLLWSTLIFASLQSLTAATIISVSGVDLGPFSIYSGQYLASSWSETGAYKDVEISARLAGQGVGTAYLMTQIGPGTTTAQQIASAPFEFPPAAAPQTLFSGLSLGPGTYYLILASNGGSNGPNLGGWFGANSLDQSLPSPTIITATGVTRNTDYLDFVGEPSFPYSPYPPANGFTAVINPPYAPLTLQYAVVAVPEPTTALLLGAAFAVFISTRRRR